MTQQRSSLAIFNRGRISPLALARTDVDRVAISAETQTNYIPRVLGAMSFRPGFGFFGEVIDDGVLIPFVYAIDDTAILELTPGSLRIWDTINDNPALLTAPTPGFSVLNPSFSASLAGWDDADETSCVSQHVSGGLMGLTGTGYNSAIRRQEVSTTSAGLRHRLRIAIQRGPVEFRVGSSAGSDNFVARTFLSTGFHSISFFPTTDSFWIEFANSAKFEVLVESCIQESAGIISLPTVWADNETLLKVRTQQSYDVVYCAAPGDDPRRIERRPHQSWSIVAYQPTDGPFLTENLTRTTIAASGITGTVTLTANKRIFAESNVGSLYRLTSVGQAVTSALSADETWTNAIRVAGVGADREFTLTISGTWTGTVSLQRSIGEEGNWVTVTTRTANTTEDFNDQLDNTIIFYRIGFDATGHTSGSTTCSLTYDNGSITGVVRVTDYISRTTATAVVLKDLGSTAATEIWAEGAWSTRRGFPSAVALWDGRSWWARQGYLWGSISDAFDNFDPDFPGDAGPVNKFLAEASGEMQWLLPLQRLLAGTEGNIISIRASALDEPVTQTNFVARPVSTKGAKAAQPLVDDDRGIYLSSASRPYEATFEAQRGDYIPTDLTVLVPEIASPAIRRVAIQYQPDTRIWGTRSDGTIALLVRDPAEDVRGWIDVETPGASGVVRDVCVLPTAGISRVYILVRRSIDGEVKFYLERMAAETEAIGGAVNKQADSYKAYSGAPTSTLSGLAHLEGQTVVIWADGKDRGTAVVTSGQIDLPGTFSQICAGLSYTAEFKSAKFALQIQGGSSLTQSKKLDRLGLILANTHYQGLEFGQDFTTMDNLPPVDDGQITEEKVWESYDRESVVVPGTRDTDARLCLRSTAPRPCTILAAVIGTDTDD